MDTPTNEDASVLFEFAQAVMTDRGQGEYYDLAHYLPRFPGREVAIAREFALLTSSVPPHAAAQGQRIGRHVLVRLLGSGGQGDVWLAEEPQLRRQVAIKLLHCPSGVVAPARIDRFRREAALLAKFDHPGICAVYDADFEHQPPYLVMSYVPGETLAHRLARRRIPPGDASDVWPWVVLFERVADALHIAHLAGVVHRDLKPANIMLSASDQPVLLDFGLAGCADATAALTRSGEFFGTVPYMSPEQIRGAEQIDARTDVWSLAVCLYQCLTGQLPFARSTQESTMQAILHDDPPSVRVHRPGLPVPVATILAMALQKDRSKRYPSAAALGQDLARARLGDPILARRSSPWQRLQRWMVRHPARAAISICLWILAFVVIVSAATIWRSHDAVAQARGSSFQATQASTQARQELLDRLMRSRLLDLAIQVPEMPGATLDGATFSQIIDSFREFGIDLEHDATTGIVGAIGESGRRNLSLREDLIFALLGLHTRLDMAEVTRAEEEMRGAAPSWASPARRKAWRELARVQGRWTALVPKLQAVLGGILDPWQQRVLDHEREWRRSRGALSTLAIDWGGRSSIDLAWLASILIVTDSKYEAGEVLDLLAQQRPTEPIARGTLHLFRGSMHFSERRWGDAVADLSEAARDIERFMPLQVMLSEAAMRDGKLELAESAARRARELANDGRLATLADLLVEKVLRARGKRAEASHFRAGAQRDVLDRARRSPLASSLMPMAVEAREAVTAASPDIARRQAWLLAASSPGTAVGMMRDLVARSPSDMQLRTEFITMLEQVGRRADALLEAKAALIVAPEDPVALATLGWMEDLEGDATGAAHLEAAVAQDAAPWFAYSCLAQLRTKSGRRLDGIAVLRNGLGHYPDHVSLLNQLARMLEQCNQVAASAEAWQRLVAASNGDLKAHLGLARSLQLSGRAPEAAALLDGLARPVATDEDLRLLEARVSVYATLGDLPRAMVLIQRARELKPTVCMEVEAQLLWWTGTDLARVRESLLAAVLAGRCSPKLRSQLACVEVALGDAQAGCRQALLAEAGARESALTDAPYAALRAEVAEATTMIASTSASNAERLFHEATMAHMQRCHAECCAVFRGALQDPECAKAGYQHLVLDLRFLRAAASAASLAGLPGGRAVADGSELGYAELTLSWLEQDLDVRLRAPTTPTAMRLQHVWAARYVLLAPEFAFLRYPPSDAPWSGRAMAFFRRLREALSVWGAQE